MTKHSFSLPSSTDTASTNECNFFIIQENAGFCFKNTSCDTSYLVFCLKGEIIVHHDKEKRSISSGEVLLITRSLQWEGEITSTEAQILIHTFGIKAIDSDKTILRTLTGGNECNGLPDQSGFGALPMNDALNLYIRTIILHLDKGIRNYSFWSLKHQEIIYLLLIYYQKDILNLLYYLYSDSLSFKNLVYTHSQTAKSCAELAQLCGYDLKNFSKLFKDVFNQTVYQWLQERKAEQVKELISLSDVPFKTIMYELDFTSPSHLNKFCKKYFGATPTQLREKSLLENYI